jgi:hypothetical protein
MNTSTYVLNNYSNIPSQSVVIKGYDFLDKKIYISNPHSKTYYEYDIVLNSYNIINTSIFFENSKYEITTDEIINNDFNNNILSKINPTTGTIKTTTQIQNVGKSIYGGGRIYCISENLQKLFMLDLTSLIILKSITNIDLSNNSDMIYLNGLLYVGSKHGIYIYNSTTLSLIKHLV